MTQVCGLAAPSLRMLLIWRRNESMLGEGRQKVLDVGRLAVHLLVEAHGLPRGFASRERIQEIQSFGRDRHEHSSVDVADRYVLSFATRRKGTHRHAGVWAKLSHREARPF